MKYVFANKINDTDHTGIVDITTNPPELICLCDEAQSKLLLEALNIYSKKEVEQEVDSLPKKNCDKCGGKIRRTHASSCPTNGMWYCEKCIDPEGRIYNDKYFGKT